MKPAVKVKDIPQHKLKKVKTKAVALRKKTMPVNIDAGTVAINPEAMIMAAIHSGAQMDTIERLLAMRERIQKEKAEIEFWRAMANFQAECPVIIKSNKVNFQSKKGSNVNYQYAPLDVIIKAVRSALKNNSLSYSFTSTQTDKTYTAICHAHHVLGHTHSSSFTIDIDADSNMNDAQRTGTARSYANRYAFCNCFGILTSEQDTDGHGLDKPNKLEDPDAKKKAGEEAERKKQEVLEMAEVLKNLPQNIKDAFKALGYADKNDKGKAAYLFCKGHKFNNEMILKHLNMLADNAK